MKFVLIVFIISGVVFAIGVGNLSYNTSILLEKYPDLQLVYDGGLDPGQEVATPIKVTEGEKITISILTDSKNPLYFYIEDEKEIIVENIFSEKLSYSLFVNQSGTHVIGVGNMGDTTLQISNYITEEPIFDTEFIKGLSENSTISYLLISISIVLFLVGMGIIVIKKTVKTLQKNKWTLTTDIKNELFK